MRTKLLLRFCGVVPMPLGNSNCNLEGTCLGNGLTGLCVLMGSNEPVVKAWPDLRSESSDRY